jgi:hypothetical protein
MKFFSGRRTASALAAIALLLGACSPIKRSSLPVRMPPTSELVFTENEQIAGEIMAYLIQVVLGVAGAPEKRQAWSTRGLELPLDFDMVSRRMHGPVPLRAELMVLDTNILGLSRVLYQYDPRLNLFKGTRDTQSLYPCAELMAIRLLLLQKRHRGETVSLAAMNRHLALFSPERRDAAGEELTAMGLTAVEFRFLKAVFRSEPAFLRYMQHPFIVSTLRKIGVAQPDAFTLAADLKASYDQLSDRSRSGTEDQTVTVAIVPAMMPLPQDVAPEETGRSSGNYFQVLKTIRTAIKKELNRRRDLPDSAPVLIFYTPSRPVTIYPGNADRVIGQLCPTADFTVIMLGKNVYRAVFIDPDTDIYPHKRWLYLDVDDVRYGQTDADIKTVVRAILPAVEARAMPSSS